MKKTLYRSLHERRIAGVCGGIADYLEIDPTLVRLGAVLLLFSGVGFPTYLVAWIIMPLDPGAYGISTSAADERS
jgi:phage shock protein PspC (stress-responsive transcriptional regulator)